MKKIACLVGWVMLAASLSAALTSTTTTISSALNPSTYGQSVTFTATVTSSQGAPPDGETVTFLQGATQLGTSSLSGGSATFTTSSLTGGTDQIKASYGGDSIFGGSKSRPVAQVGKSGTHNNNSDFIAKSGTLRPDRRSHGERHRTGRRNGYCRQRRFL